MFHISRSSDIRRYFHILFYCLLESFKVSKVCFIIFRCSFLVFIKGVLWIFLVHIFRRSGIRVCLSRFCCQRFSNCRSVFQRFIKVLSILFVRRFMVQLLKSFATYSLSEVLISKDFFRSCFLFL